MVAPLQQILLIFIISAYSAMGTSPAVQLSPHMTLWVVLGGNILLVVAAWKVRRRALAQIDRAADPLAILNTFERTMHRLRAISIGWLAFDLFFLRWGTLVQQVCRHHIPPAASYTWIPFTEMVWLTPPILVWISFWLVQYRIEALTNHAAPMPFSVHDRAFHPMPTCGQYIVLQMRTNLYLIFLVLAIWALQRAATTVAVWVGLGGWAAVIGLVPVLLVLLFTGKILTVLWSTAPLPNGPMRSRLLAMAARRGIRFSDVRVWHTHYRIVNGAVIGPLRLARYVILSDALLENLSTQEVEAVFAHELGHGYHRHILWYLTAILAAALISSGLSSLVEMHYPQDQRLLDGLTMAAMVAFLVYGISRISRFCEHQADWFAAQCMGEQLSAPDPTPNSRSIVEAAPRVNTAASSAVPIPTWHDGFVTPWLMADSVTAATPPPLVCGAQAFSSALWHVVMLSGRPADKPGWMHPSVHQRTTFLADLAVSPTAVAVFDRKMRHLRRLIRWSLVLGVLCIFTAMALAPPAPSQPANPAPTPVRRTHLPAASHDARPWIAALYPKLPAHERPGIMMCGPWLGRNYVPRQHGCGHPAWPDTKPRRPAPAGYPASLHPHPPW